MRIWDCGCGHSGDCDCYGLAGMGSVPGGVPTGIPTVGTVVTEGWTAAIKSFFDAAWTQIESFLGIGDGRREADLIVPLQNAIAARLAEIVAAIPQADLGALKSMNAELQTMAREFTAFVSDPRFTDGRASAQALADIMPIINDNISKTASRIAALGGIVQPQIYTSPYTNQVYTSGVSVGAGGLDTTTLALLGIGVFLLFKGKIL